MPVNMADLFTKYNCTNCQDDITGIRVHCAECENFDLCLQCFAAGAEIGAHQNNHPYQFMDTGTAILAVFRGKGAWTAREEIRLLDAIEQYGFGNWEDISKHIETKSAEEAKEEYVSKFLNGTIGRHTWIPAQSQRPTLKDHTSEDDGPLGDAALQKLPPLDITPEEATQLGYMPNRDSFEREYDPTAEQLISSLTMSNDDTECDYLLKLAHVDMYTRRLRERVRRKRLVRDYQLVANFFRNKNYAQQPELTREQREFRDRFRVFAQFFTSNEYERQLASLEREKELRIRLAELYRYRANGLTKIDECRHFEQHAAMAQIYETGQYGHGKTQDNNIPLITGSHLQPGSSLHSPLLNSTKAEMLDVNEASSSSTGRKNTPPIGDPTCSAGLLHNKNFLDSCRGLSDHTTTTMTTATASVKAGTPLTMISSDQQLPQQLFQPTATSINKNLQQVGPIENVADEKQPAVLQDSNTNVATNKTQVANEQQSTKGQLQEQQQPMSSILRAQLEELKRLPQPLGTNLLSQNEQHLCKAFNLPPTTYLTLKTIMLSGAPMPANPSPVENSVRKYFIKAGWLSH